MFDKPKVWKPVHDLVKEELVSDEISDTKVMFGGISIADPPDCCGSLSIV